MLIGRYKKGGVMIPKETRIHNGTLFWEGERLRELLRLYNEGKSYEELAKIYDLSVGRIRELIRKQKPRAVWVFPWQKEAMEKVYIARELCGCITGMVVDEPQLAKETAKDVASWIQGGRHVERVSGEVAKGYAFVVNQRRAV